LPSDDAPPHPPSFPTRRSSDLAAMAVGVGANTAVFSLAYRLLITPLPYPQSDRLVIIHEERGQGRGRSVSYPNFLDWREAQGSRSEEHTSELQSLRHLVCRLLL